MSLSFLRIPRSAVLAALALGIGALAAVFLSLHVRERIRRVEDQARLPMVQRIVAARDLPAGTRLVSDHLALREFPAQWVGRDTLPAARYADLEGRVLTTALQAGDAILAAHTLMPQTAFSAHLAPGRRAITLPVDQVNSLSGLLQPGDLIDLYVSFDHHRKRLTAPLLQGVLVLATGRETRPAAAGTGAEDVSYSTVTLDAAPDDVVKLVAARQAGALTAILRHPEDDGADRRAARGDLAALLGINTPAPPATRKAVILYGGGAARGMPAWAMPGRGVEPRPGNGLFNLPAAQSLSSAWQRDGAGLLPSVPVEPGRGPDGVEAQAGGILQAAPWPNDPSVRDAWGEQP
ncbi:Flp pilus assembly protein CpaB [uncultured Castellaniella sp.]|uniref:Flp pilus assembly protein CpaB n=1 Tax=uncultured Castellaniella sp. TaxID=647907 RepID=UPI00263503E1|nr:Flp pilus assembly protein CpaB [uncultured Castellaniella sp.]